MLSAPVLLFDGGCGFCRTWVNRLARWDRAGRIQLMPSQSRSSIEGLPPLDDDALNRAMHFVTPDGRVYRGARALPAMLRYLPGGAVLRPLLFIPGVLPVADRIYDRIAANRHKLGCGGTSCSYPY